MLAPTLESSGHHGAEKRSPPLADLAEERLAKAEPSSSTCEVLGSSSLPATPLLNRLGGENNWDMHTWLKILAQGATSAETSGTMLSSLAIVLLPLMQMLSGCGSPELMAPVALSEMPGISKGPHSHESPGQETSQSQESRQLLATAGNPIPQSECSYQCSKLGFQYGGKCSDNYCTCLVEYREVAALWNGWVSEGICSPATAGSETTGCWTSFAHTCDFPWRKGQTHVCCPPGHVDISNEIQAWGGYDSSDPNACQMWAWSFPVGRPRNQHIEAVSLGTNETAICTRFARIFYTCSA
eukprot:Skav202307  [mRNA]  locus=scaffold60:104960:107506:+ [translate_table: standard]